MSIRPVDFNGMIQRTQDVSTLKQNEDNRPVVEQQTIFSQEMKKVEQNLHQVVHAKEKENAGYRYDAKEKGNGHYEKEERKKKDKKQQKADNVYLKGQTSGFDIISPFPLASNHIHTGTQAPMQLLFSFLNS